MAIDHRLAGESQGSCPLRWSTRLGQDAPNQAGIGQAKIGVGSWRCDALANPESPLCRATVCSGPSTESTGHVPNRRTAPDTLRDGGGPRLLLRTLRYDQIHHAFHELRFVQHVSCRRARKRNVCNRVFVNGLPRQGIELLVNAPPNRYAYASAGYVARMIELVVLEDASSAGSIKQQV
jgi:hypothetical protein